MFGLFILFSFFIKVSLSSPLSFSLLGKRQNLCCFSYFCLKMAPEGNEFTQRFEVKYNEWTGKSQDSEGKDRVETKSALPDHEIFGFKNEIKSVENFLLDQKVYKEFKSLVIVGEYGVGKTTLCQKIFNNKEVKNVYAPRIWVSMHKDETKKRQESKKISVLKRILEDLGVEDEILETIHVEAIEESARNQEAGGNDTSEKMEISGLLYALHLNLRWKKYLIVFDDVREDDEWDEKIDEKVKKDEKWGKYLSDGFPKGSGGRVIYTTREETIAKKLVAERHEIHRLCPLSDHQSVWDIYEAVVKKKGKEPPRNDKKCFDELMNKSCGLPLAARLIAELDPVFLDDETFGQEGSTNGQTNSAGRLDQPNP